MRDCRDCGRSIQDVYVLCYRCKRAREITYQDTVRYIDYINNSDNPDGHPMPGPTIEEEEYSVPSNLKRTKKPKQAQAAEQDFANDIFGIPKKAKTEKPAKPGYSKKEAQGHSEDLVEYIDATRKLIWGFRQSKERGGQGISPELVDKIIEGLERINDNTAIVLAPVIKKDSSIKRNPKKIHSGHEDNQAARFKTLELF